MGPRRFVINVYSWEKGRVGGWLALEITTHDSTVHLTQILVKLYPRVYKSFNIHSKEMEHQFLILIKRLIYGALMFKQFFSNEKIFIIGNTFVDGEGPKHIIEKLFNVLSCKKFPLCEFLICEWYGEIETYKKGLKWYLIWKSINEWIEEKFFCEIWGWELFWLIFCFIFQLFLFSF